MNPSLSIRSNTIVFAVTFLIIVSCYVSVFDDIWGQTRGKIFPEPGWSNITVPAQLGNASGQEMPAIPQLENQSGNAAPPASLQAPAQITKNCSVTSNPCFGTDGDENMVGDDGIN